MKACKVSCLLRQSSRSTLRLCSIFSYLLSCRLMCKIMTPLQRVILDTIFEVIIKKEVENLVFWRVDKGKQCTSC